MHQRFLDQRQKQVADRIPWYIPVGGDCRDRAERGAAEKDRQSREQQLLRIGQEAVAPVDERVQGLLSR